MPHISRKKLKKEVAKKIYDRLVKTITSGGSNRGYDVLGELLTPIEQTMLAKRLAAVAMLSQGISSYEVRKVLKLSSKTSAYIMYDIELGKYKHIEKLTKKKKDREKFWTELEVIVRMGMPEMGKGRWKWINEYTKKK